MQHLFHAPAPSIDPTHHTTHKPTEPASQTHASKERGEAMKASEVYDRQIRLWGLEAQKRMQAARVLFVGLRALQAEVGVACGACPPVDRVRASD